MRDARRTSAYGSSSYVGRGIGVFESTHLRGAGEMGWVPAFGASARTRGGVGETATGGVAAKGYGRRDGSRIRAFGRREHRRGWGVGETATGGVAAKGYGRRDGSPHPRGQEGVSVRRRFRPRVTGPRVTEDGMGPRARTRGVPVLGPRR